MFDCSCVFLKSCGADIYFKDFGAQRRISDTLECKSVFCAFGGAGVYFGRFGMLRLFLTFWSAEIFHAFWSASVYFKRFRAQAWMYISAMPVDEKVSVAAIRPWAHLAVLPN